MVNETILAVIIAFVVSAVLCPIVIPFLHRLKFGQQVRDDGPQTHLKKQGTPTMGGLVILSSIIITSLLYIRDYPKIIPYYTEPEALELGSTEIMISGQQFQIYDRDRVICDCLKYESKLEREVFKEALQSYIRDSQKDISALMAYARARKVVGKVQSMIGVWL